MDEKERERRVANIVVDAVRELQSRREYNVPLNRVMSVLDRMDVPSELFTYKGQTALYLQDVREILENDARIVVHTTYSVRLGA